MIEDVAIHSAGSASGRGGWWWAGAALALFAALMLGILVVRPPLVASPAIKVRYAIDGRPSPTRAEAFHPVFMRHLIYVRIPVPANTRYGWFLVDTRRGVVSSPHGPRYHRGLGFHYIHRDQAFGIPLTDGKIEDTWNVSFESEAVTFSNGAIDVTVSEWGA